MHRTTLLSLGLATIAFVQPAAAASPMWTAKDPFVGKWRLDVSRSTIVDEMKVAALDSNRLAFNFEGAPTETVVADGTDQPGLPGTTLSVKAEDPHYLTVLRKQDGKVVVSAKWKLSPDGRTLRDYFKSIQPNGPAVTVDYLYRRTAGKSGFAGTWQSTTKPLGLKAELGIDPYEKKGLSFHSAGSDKNVIFDGRDHPVPGKDDPSFSGHRRGPRALEYTERNGGRITRERQFEISRDGRTLTETIHVAGRATPDVYVFEREGATSAKGADAASQ
jgi:hypothetical protein